ncbi:hypothetical protein LTR56_025918 [Elasticomyces elasticus]|nr:hypothetical protein LTR56_025918 [Elasticomyces elasticus]KAK3618311.1 hypothetical protein LTR22_026421 [Elasticomyces elasticus]KAK4902988.1 hypothetical protein LTR49_026941 [Elasticomyces elasticus]KAK5737082.1 hypothetical protein LTS12_026000 [Elasticomyces elasticus]
MFTTLSLPPRPVSKPFDFRFIPVDISQKSPVRRRRKRLGASASQHSANHGLTCSTDTSPQAIGPHAREESPESQMQVPRLQATSSTTSQLCPAEGPAPTPSRSLLDECRHVEALRNGLEHPAIPQHDANLLPLPMPPSSIGSECSALLVAERVMHYSATVEQEPADSLISSVPPAPIIGPCDERIRDKHTLPISRRPMATRNVEVHRGSADRDSLCRPGPVQATAETADIEMAPLKATVSVKRRSNPIVLIRLSRTIWDDYAQALDYRESCDLADDPKQTHVQDNDKGRRCLRARVQPSMRHRTKKGSRGSLVPSAARMDGHKAVGKVWSDLHENRLLQLRSENELPWKRIAGPYFGSTDPAWLQRRYMALTIRPLSQGRHPPGAGLRRSRRVGHGA